MRNSHKLIDNCEFNNICFSDIVSDLRRIMDGQTIIFNMLSELIMLLKENTLLVQLKNNNDKEGEK